MQGPGEIWRIDWKIQYELRSGNLGYGLVGTKNDFWQLVAKNQFEHRIRDNRRMKTDENLSEVVISYGNKISNVGLTFLC
jgi:hypothetical protein